MRNPIWSLALFHLACEAFMPSSFQRRAATFASSFCMVKKEKSRAVSSPSQEPKPKDAVVAASTIIDPDTIDSPVLQKVYPAMLQHLQQYGHVNIPLGSSPGRACETLRRLHIQQKLSAPDVELLESLQFRFYSLEQVYETADFDILFQRLVVYQEQTGDASPPKKYAADPELGAWVTGIRRTGPDSVNPSHAQQLDEIGFLWTSPRVCGSAFMQQYRELQERLQQATTTTKNTVWNDGQVQNWIKAQQEAAKRGTLSETRKHYLSELLDCADWIEHERPWEKH